MDEPLELLPRQDIASAVGKGRALLVITVGEVIAVVVLLTVLGFDIRDGLTMAIVAAMVLFSVALTVALRSTVRRSMTTHAPTRLTVAGDRIIIERPQGRGTEWRKEHGGLVRASGRGANRSIQIGESVDAIPPVTVRMFGFDDIKAACIARGWSWQEGNGPILDAMPGQPVAAKGAELVLRDGTTAPPDPKKRKRRAWLVMLGCAVIYFAAGVVAIVVTTRTGTDLTWLPMVVVFLSVGGMIGGLAWVVWRALRGSRVSLVVEHDRVTSWYGEASVLASRESVDRVEVGDKRMVMYTPSGSRALMSGCFGQRDAIVALLRQHGWPVTDRPAAKL